jgi:hypothetical protein
MSLVKSGFMLMHALAFWAMFSELGDGIHIAYLVISDGRHLGGVKYVSWDRDGDIEVLPAFISAGFGRYCTVCVEACVT